MELGGGSWVAQLVQVDVFRGACAGWGLCGCGGDIPSVVIHLVRVPGWIVAVVTGHGVIELGVGVHGHLGTGHGRWVEALVHLGHSSSWSLIHSNLTLWVRDGPTRSLETLT